MTDDLTYFTEVLKQLDALHNRATKSQDMQLANLATDASEPIGVLVGCLLADSRPRVGKHGGNGNKASIKLRHSTPKVLHLKPMGGAGIATKAHVEAYRRAGVGQEAVMWPVGDGVQRALKWLARVAGQNPNVAAAGCQKLANEGPMTDASDKDEQADLDAKVEKFRERSAARVAEIKGALMTWLEPSDTRADTVCITNALLDLALDRHAALHDANGFDLIESAYRRALKRSRRPLQ